MLLQRVRQFVRQNALFQADTRVVAALSGGSDSVALMVLLHELDASGDVRFAGAAHLNHQLRPEAQRDELFSASVARSLSVPFVAEREDVLARARRGRTSIEHAARTARYDFLERARAELGADVVALGHTRDDQAETFLLRLLRGAGPRGLASIHPRHGSIVRPLLDCRRTELRDFLAIRQMSYVEDESNVDVSIPRNRVRAELLPLLSDRFNPAIVDILAHEAVLDRELWDWLESAAAEYEACEEGGRPRLVRQAGKGSGPVFELNVERLRSARPALRRLVLWRAMNRASNGRPVGFVHVEAALHLLEAGSGGIDAPGHRVQRSGPSLVLTGTCADTIRRGAPAKANLFSYPLSIPGEVQLTEAGCVVAAELDESPKDLKTAAASGRGPLARVRWDLCQRPLAVRNRRPGDRFRPVGVGGRKKLQDYFVDRKVAQIRRDLVPIVVDATDRIIWVAGYGIDEAFRVTDRSQSVLLLRLKQV
jgi:tRNA(Ile)-lysidine synthase